MRTFRFNTMGLVSLIAIVATVAAMILLYKFIVPEKRRPRLNKLGQFLHDAFNFKFLVIEKVLQFFYILATTFVICYGIAMLFGISIYRSEYYNRTDWYGIIGILIALFGPIVIRLVYEGLMMFVLLVKNVIQINKKLKATVEGAEYQFPSLKDLTSKDNFDFIKKAPSASVQPVVVPNVQPAAEPSKPETASENE